ncbi:MAG TPA: glycosyltransferase family A protein, partial [Candidatus Binatia bacterium]|nr:glycosyltransferase family A protein [Candidatus Binatia bacterium]
VVDDGSDDGTCEEVTRRAAADARVRYVRRTREPAGANVCRNLGIRESIGDFIVFLDSDDLLAPNCLGRRIGLMQRNLDLDFATFQAGVFEDTVGDIRREPDTQLQGDDLLRFLFFECPWLITGPMWRKTSVLRLGMFDESLPSWQDIDLHIRAITAGFRYLRFAEIDHHVRWQFDLTKVSAEQRRSPDHLEAAGTILEKFEGLVREGPGMNWVRQRALCSLYFFVAEQWVAMGNLSSALKSWKRIRERALGSRVLHVSGTLLLTMSALGFPGSNLSDRMINRWKGWMRLRTNPQLVQP